jgi:hypothetical protein
VKKFRLKALIAVLLGAAALVFGTSGVALADPGNLPILYAGTGFGHACVNYGGDAEYSALICSDIVTGGSGSSYWARGQVEAMCATTGSSPQLEKCQQVYIVAGLESGAGILSSEQWTYAGCAGNCAGPGQRNYFQENSYSYSAPSSSCASNLGSSNQVYNIVFGGPNWDSYLSFIVLPDGNTQPLFQGDDGDGQNSGHFFVCP